MVRSPWALLLALSSCHLVSGAGDFSTSWAVGDWESTVPILSKHHTMTLEGDGTGSVIFHIPTDTKPPSTVALEFSVSWKTAGRGYELLLTCADAACGDAFGSAVTADCSRAEDGERMHCEIHADVPGATNDAFDFERVTE